MRKIRRNKNNTLVLLVTLLAFMTIGYSILSTNLNITGASTINNLTLDIHWNNVQVNSNSNATVTSGATINSGKTEVAFNITLNKPGDLYEFTVDAVNAGTIDGMIDVITKKVYQSNGTTETYKVRVYFKKDIEASQFPQTITTLVFKFGVTYIQKDNTALVNRKNSQTKEVVQILTGLSSNGNEYSKMLFILDSIPYSLIGGDGGENYHNNVEVLKTICSSGSGGTLTTATSGMRCKYTNGGFDLWVNADKTISYDEF